MQPSNAGFQLTRLFVCACDITPGDFATVTEAGTMHRTASSIPGGSQPIILTGLHSARSSVFVCNWVPV
jgi:hypothetical protein